MRLRWTMFIALAAVWVAACSDGAPERSPSPPSPRGSSPAPQVSPTEPAAPTPVAPEPTRAEPHEKESFEVYLRPGESISDLARWSGLSSDEIMRTSELTSGGDVQAGQRLRLALTPREAARFMTQRLAALGERRIGRDIERRAHAESAGEDVWEQMKVRVRPNEIVGLYASWAGTSVQEILATNPALNPNRIAPGQTIAVPIRAGHRIDFEEAREAWHAGRSGDRSAAVDAGGTAPRAAPDAGAPAAEPCPRTYRVRSGDIVGKLARRWGVTLRDIRACNPRVNLDRVHIGTTLRVPDAATLPE